MAGKSKGKNIAPAFVRDETFIVILLLLIFAAIVKGASHVQMSFPAPDTTPSLSSVAEGIRNIPASTEMASYSSLLDGIRHALKDASSGTMQIWDRERPSGYNPTAGSYEGYDSDVAITGWTNDMTDGTPDHLEEANETTTVADDSYSWTEWNKDEFPNYYRIAGEAVKAYEIEPGEIRYTGFDSLGRTQMAAANITYSIVEESAGWRCDFANDVDEITGWIYNGKSNNSKATIPISNGRTTTGYFWNRSHLIADSLGGYKHVYSLDGTIDKEKSVSEKHNLITGTRTQNVGLNDGKGGMAYCEQKVLAYMTSHRDVTTYYCVTPIYNGDDIVPRSVYVDMLTSDGVINEHVEVFNCMEGYDIDYTTGVFHKLTED